MTTKDELNGQTEKRTDKKDETLDRAEELKKELVFRWGFQRGEPVWDMFKNELDEYTEAYHKSELKKKPKFCIRCNEVIRTGLEQN